MRVSKLEVKNYRNLKEDSFDFDDKINYIYGKNAQGKTNLLESIWMLTGTRSFRGTKDLDILNFETTNAKLNSQIFLEQRNQKISIFFANGRRKVFLNDVPKSYPTEIIGKFRAVLFTPSHLALIKDGPDNRRRFIDAALCQITPAYAHLTIKYNQILKHRNSLLKSISKRSVKNDLLEVWDYKLAELGVKIIKKRLEYLLNLKKEVQKIQSEMSSGEEKLNIRYISSALKKSLNNTELEMQKEFILALKQNHELDKKRGFTSLGPHKDDLEILLKDKILKQFGSQGQQRSAVIALKLSEAVVMEKLIKDPPVVLLDDVMSELDEVRRNYMIEKLKGWQVFITGCDKNLISNFNDVKSFHIFNGKSVE